MTGMEVDEQVMIGRRIVRALQVTQRVRIEASGVSHPEDVMAVVAATDEVVGAFLDALNAAGLRIGEKG